MATTAKSKSTARKRIKSQTKLVSITETRRRDNVARHAGGPLDRAVYKCGCGTEFEAAVTTSVSCPHCGAGQAW